MSDDKITVSDDYDEDEDEVNESVTYSKSDLEAAQNNLDDENDDSDEWDEYDDEDWEDE